MEGITKTFFRGRRRSPERKDEWSAWSKWGTFMTFLSKDEAFRKKDELLAIAEAPRGSSSRIEIETEYRVRKNNILGRLKGDIWLLEYRSRSRET